MAQGRCRGFKVVPSSSYNALPIHVFRHFCRRMNRLAVMHSVTDRKTDRQTDVSVMPIADHTECNTIG